MSIKVIGAGLGRTGTLSLKVALEELGFTKCYHMVEVIARPQDAGVWEAAARGEPVDWDALFAGYQATVDWPSCSFYRELMEHYPDAKLILTVRDPEKWYESAMQTIYSVGKVMPAWAGFLAPRMRTIGRMAGKIIWEGMFGGRFEDRALAIRTFNEHNERVRREVPPERLLVFEVREGWGPLCAFLGVPVPEGKPFPHVNDAAEFRARIVRMGRAARVLRYTAAGLAAIAVVAVIAVAIRLAS